MRKLPLALAITAALLALGAAPAMAADKDCKDFNSQAAAQAYFEAHGGSPSNNVDRLDADHDGKACETFPYNSSASASASAADSASSGASAQPVAASSLPRTGPSSVLAPLGIALLVIGFVAVLASRQRRRAIR